MMHTNERTFKQSLVLMLTILCGAAHSQDTCPQFSLTSPPMGTYSCPGSNITYTCVLNSSALGVITSWTGSAFQCPRNMISLTQRVGGTVQSFLSGLCGSLSAVTTNVTSICYTSVLTIPVVQALNGATVVCQDGISSPSAVVGSDTLKIMTSPGPVGNMTVTSTSVDQLTVTWTPPTTGGVPTSYNVTINDSSNTQVPIPTSGPLQHTFTNLTKDTLYTVSVVAINCAGSSNETKRTGPDCPIMTCMEKLSEVIPNNPLNHLEISWIPVGSSVSAVGSGGTYVGHGSTKCITSPCGTTSILVLNCTLSTYATMGWVFNQPSYCLVCCSTDSSVPPDSSVCSISTTRGTEVNVSLSSNQAYYCKAAATNTNSKDNVCPVVKSVEVFFSHMQASPILQSNESSNSSSHHTTSTKFSNLNQLYYILFVLVAIFMAIILLYKVTKNRVTKKHVHKSTG